MWGRRCSLWNLLIMLPRPMVCIHLLSVQYLLVYLIFSQSVSLVSFQSGGFSVFAGVGERTREGNDLYREMIESGVIKLGDKQVLKLQFFTLALKLFFCGFIVDIGPILSLPLKSTW